MSNQIKLPGHRATRNRRIKNWHVWLLLSVLVFVAMAFAVYWFLSSDQNDPVAIDEVGAVGSPPPSVSSSPEAQPKAKTDESTASSTPSPEPSEPSEPTQTIDKSVRTVIYNNTNVTGRAQGVADEAKALGWNVVQTANWQGTVPSSTVFYSVGLEQEALALAKDLQIDRVIPNHSGISLKGLSVVLRS